VGGRAADHRGVLARKLPAWPIAVQGPPPSTLATSARM